MLGKVFVEVFAIPRRNVVYEVTKTQLYAMADPNIFKVSHWLVAKCNVGSTLQGFHSTRIVYCKLPLLLHGFILCAPWWE
jgi:hypothetical protein